MNIKNTIYTYINDKMIEYCDDVNVCDIFTNNIN